MVVFSAHIINVFTDEEEVILFDIDCQSGKSEKDVYLEAMSTAYDKTYNKGCMWELIKLVFEYVV